MLPRNNELDFPLTTEPHKMYNKQKKCKLNRGNCWLYFI